MMPRFIWAIKHLQLSHLDLVRWIGSLKMKKGCCAERSLPSHFCYWAADTFKSLAFKEHTGSHSRYLWIKMTERKGENWALFRVRVCGPCGGVGSTILVVSYIVGNEIACFVIHPWLHSDRKLVVLGGTCFFLYFRQVCNHQTCSCKSVRFSKMDMKCISRVASVWLKTTISLNFSKSQKQNGR